MNSVLDYYFPPEKLSAVFNCAESSIPIYHQRFRSIQSIAAPYLKNKKLVDLVHNHTEICMAITNSAYASLTKRNFVDAINRVISSNEVASADCGASELLPAYESYGQLLAQYDDEYSQKRSDISSELFPLFQEGIKKLNPHSFDSLILRLYVEVPVRDDFQLTMIHPDNLFVDTDTETNYAIPYLEEKVVRILIQKSKNVGWKKSQKPRLYTLSPELSHDFLQYWKENKFPQYIFEGKLYKKVGKALEKIGMKTSRDSINFIRKLVAHSAKEINQRAEAAYRSLHTVATAAIYEH